MQASGAAVRLYSQVRRDPGKRFQESCCAAAAAALRFRFRSLRCAS
jgi:hypothetical protein